MSNSVSEIILKALYASVVEDEGILYVGFAEGEDEEEPYVMFRREGEGPVWFEVSDESFGGDDVVEKVVQTAKGIEITIAPEHRVTMGFAEVIAVRLPAYAESRDEAIEALREMLGDKFQG